MAPRRPGRQYGARLVLGSRPSATLHGNQGDCDKRQRSGACDPAARAPLLRRRTPRPARAGPARGRDRAARAGAVRGPGGEWQDDDPRRADRVARGHRRGSGGHHRGHVQQARRGRDGVARGRGAGAAGPRGRAPSASRRSTPSAARSWPTAASAWSRCWTARRCCATCGRTSTAAQSAASTTPSAGSSSTSASRPREVGDGPGAGPDRPRLPGLRAAPRRTPAGSTSTTWSPGRFGCWRLGLPCSAAGASAARTCSWTRRRTSIERQLRLALLLAAPANRIFLVGDDDQTIYGWRLADVRRVLRPGGVAAGPDGGST